jgi:hypothetical protein
MVLVLTFLPFSSSRTILPSWGCPHVMLAAFRLKMCPDVWLSVRAYYTCESCYDPDGINTRDAGYSWFVTMSSGSVMSSPVLRNARLCDKMTLFRLWDALLILHASFASVLGGWHRCSSPFSLQTLAAWSAGIPHRKGGRQFCNSLSLSLSLSLSASPSHIHALIKLSSTQSA